MAYTKRGPWADGDPGAFDADDLNAMDEAVARLGGGGVVDLGDIAGPVSIDMDAGGVFRATMTGDAAFTFTNASLPSRRRAARLMLSTQGYVPTFPGSATPAGGLSGDYVGAVDQFDVETVPGHATPMVQHVAEYGRYRPAFIGVGYRRLWLTDNGVDWQNIAASVGTAAENQRADQMGVWSPGLRAFALMEYSGSGTSYVVSVSISRDGLNWQSAGSFTAATSLPDRMSLTWNDHTEKFNIHVSNTSMFESSGDGIWAEKTLTGLTLSITGYAWSESLGIYAATDFTQNMYTSSDGLAWTAHPTGTTYTQWMLWVAEWEMFVSAGAQWLLTSTDGANWTTRISFGGNPSNVVYKPVSSGSRVIVPAVITSYGTRLYTSTDGSSWSFQYGLKGEYSHIAWNDRINLWLQLYEDSSTVQLSADGTTWGDEISLAMPGGLQPGMVLSGH